MTHHPSPAHVDAVAALSRWWAPDAAQRALAQAYLAFLAARPDATRRTCTPGHLTASAVVLSHDLTRVALVLHGIVGAWLAPGGHIEDDDASLRAAAAREVREELGLDIALESEPVTLDCHEITCRGYTVPTRHLDVRFVGRAAPDAELRVSEESRDAAWWPVDALPEGTFEEVRLLIAAGRRALRER